MFVVVTGSPIGRAPGRGTALNISGSGENHCTVLPRGPPQEASTPNCSDSIRRIG